ncbi:hypothetical protein L2D14_13180 [Thalassospiraceae bacterium LMO-JJ14]|nr:hypothetical protein L2D14_13180 [Thalassospiraceae bacterium LMO-JJ14]
MGRSTVVTVLLLFALCAQPCAARADEKPAPQNATPIDRGFGQGDACFGDKHETDDDLKTGNEPAVQEALRLLLGPGS